MPRFFTNVCLQAGEQLSLPIEVVRHMVVLRLRVGEEVRLFNNDGCDYLARILDLHKREARVEITGKIDVQSESNFVITLMISLIANDKFELVIQKAVELGVQKIIPIITEKTQRVKIDRYAGKLEHWQKIIISASEQCGRAKLASISEIKSMDEALSENKSDINFILSPRHIAIENNLVFDKPYSASLVIGPEGGFTEEEIQLANQAGFLSLNLGTRILRAETAAITAISLLHCRFGDFQIN